ncbi:type 4a pilus biogenesis protein PilO [bacterium]|nr:type 4a pilus biogenesis protein PilO [bacterium]
MKLSFGTIFVRYFWLFVLILALIVFGLGYLYLLKPNWEILKPGGSFDISTYKRIISAQKRYLAKLKDLDKNFEKLDQNKIKKLESVISTQPDLAGLMLAIDRARKISGLTITNISFKIEKGVIKTNVDLAKGNYEDFKIFLKNIEDDARIMDIKNLNMSVKNGKYSLVIDSYYQE